MYGELETFDNYNIQDDNNSPLWWLESEEDWNESEAYQDFIDAIETGE